MASQVAPPVALLQTVNGSAPALRRSPGEATLILFFNIGCAGCTGRALPLTLELAERYPRLQLFGVHSHFSPTTDQPLSQIEAVVNYFDLPYPVGVDEGSTTFERYGAEGTPHWILLNHEGAVLKSIFGSMEGARQRLAYSLEEYFGR